ncbi:bifunctional hydroxymethylpyrimidine kinase/phosphomethylpyrimidine kinase [Bacillus sp. 2205SS5-2]|uniref:bifunctional hydroxymethylpyrimidine kinase/phosphomethylpyrimidine kinase n=1 Tax=Bacillus sp. 2205SS5-2 TaxID=3109031 RepID=UPI003005B67A
MINKALTIAGSDSGGGAGIQADLKTFQELGVYGMTAITAVTAQNTLGVLGVYPVKIEGVKEQLTAISEDLPPQAVKTGMLFSAEIIKVVSKIIAAHSWRKLVVDPVMIAKGGAPLLQKEAVQALRTELIPLAYVITPNIPEAEILTGIDILSVEDRREAAKRLFQMGAKHIVIKGGHDISNQMRESIDLLFDGKNFHEFISPRIQTFQTHGTGCTFAAAITAELAKNSSVYKAVKIAKEFINAAISEELGFGHGHGPTNHWAYRASRVEIL